MNIQCALDMALSVTGGRLHNTQSKVPCVLFDHDGITYSFVYFWRYKAFAIYNNFGNGKRQKRIKNIKPSSLIYIVENIKKGIF